MGRYPFLALLEVYLKEVRGACADSTFSEMKRKLEYVHRVLLELKSKGLIDITNPRKIGERDIFGFVSWMNARDGLRSRPLELSAQKKLLQHLENFLTYWDNCVIERMVKKKQLKRPRESNVPLESFEESQKVSLITALKDAAQSESMDALGVFGHAVFCGYAGTRLKEIRLANKGDFSSAQWELTIRHPKGEGAWADPRTAMVCLPGRDLVTNYMACRERELKRRNIEDNRDIPLVPRFTGTGAERWPDGILHNVKVEVERRLGLRFDFRKLRRSYGQNLLDAGVSLESVSKAMGHASVLTTQRYYVRLRSARAFAEIEQVYASASAEVIPVDCGKARCSE